jgi:putative transposase
MDGIKHVLGIWVQTTEGAKFWAGVCAELANRGVGRADRVLRRADRLPRGDRGDLAAATVQTCVVHLIRAAMRFVSYGDRKAVAAAEADLHRRERGRRPGPPWARSRPTPNSARSTPHAVATWDRRLGPVHPVPGVPARAAPRHLHHELDRVAELPAAQGHQEPRPLPQRRRRRQAALAGDLQHRGQASPRTRQRSDGSPPRASSVDVERRCQRASIDGARSAG